MVPYPQHTTAMAGIQDIVMGTSAFLVLLAFVVTMLVLSVRDRRRRLGGATASTTRPPSQ